MPRPWRQEIELLQNYPKHKTFTFTTSSANAEDAVVLAGSMAMAFGFMKADISHIEKMVELKADKEIIEYKLDVIHTELIDLKEMIIEKENK